MRRRERVRYSVYFAFSGGRIKIGVTKNVELRLASLSSPLETPLTLIGTLLGGYRTERAIQAHLSEYKLKGEWFRDCSDLRAKITDILAKGPETFGFKRQTRRGWLGYG